MIYVKLECTSNGQTSFMAGDKMGGKSKVNEAGNYTKPGMRKQIFNRIKAGSKGGRSLARWSARKAQMMAKRVQS